MSKIHEHWTVLPHEPLQEIDDGLLGVAGEITMPLGNFPRRMTVIRLAGERTAIFSAIALAEPDMARIEAMGKPSILIVPSDHHRLDAKIWKQRYPGIQVLCPPGAREHVADVVPVDATTDILDDADAKFVVIAGTAESDSAVIVRRAGGTSIICNDIIGYVPHPHGIGAHVMARLTGFGVSKPQIPRVVMPHIKDKAALAAQLREWAAIADLKRVIVSHVTPIEDNPAQVLQGIASTL